MYDYALIYLNKGKIETTNSIEDRHLILDTWSFWIFVSVPPLTAQVPVLGFYPHSTFIKHKSKGKGKAACGEWIMNLGGKWGQTKRSFCNLKALGIPNTSGQWDSRWFSFGFFKFFCTFQILYKHYFALWGEGGMGQFQNNQFKFFIK